ncbi:MAG: serine/threonine-protein kinase [Myxococcota bacterium]|jgi:serine/threonine-protein kinase
MADRLGPYTLDKRIGAGGMADVFLARGPMGVCVVKRPHPQLCANAEFVRMFLDEASLLAQLHHPGIAQIFDLGHVRGVYYLAMEYVPGFDLMTISLEHERHGELIAPELCARIVADAAAALHYAHEARGKNGQPLNIVHRDVSPHNILLSTTGVVKLIDFGVARASTATHRTQAGFVKGKYPYMSPEQITGQDIDRRVDVYALGLVLYELLTNVRAIAGNTELEQIENARSARIRPIEQIRPNTPVPLRQILGGCLHPSPNGRYPTADHLRVDLEKYLQLVRQPVGQEDLLRLFRVVAAEVSHADFGADEPSRPTQQEQLVVADTLPPDANVSPDDPIGFAPTVPSLPRPAASFVADQSTAPGALKLEKVVSGPGTAAVDLPPVSTSPQVGPAVPHDVAVAPTRLLPPSGMRAAPSPPGRSRVAALAAVGLLLAVTAGGFAWWRSQAGDAAPDAGVPVAVVPAVDAGPAEAEPDAGAAVALAGDDGGAEAAADAGDFEPEPVRIALLRVDASPASKVYVDGKEHGDTPLELQLLAGDYTVTVRNDAAGFVRSRRFTLAAGELKRWVATAPQAAKGTLEITAQPFATMLVDGKKVTKVPVSLITLELTAGTHRVELVLEEQSLPAPRRKKRSVTVKPDATTRLTVNMLADD